ncbi:MAG TPA: M20 family peptidase [Myxococcota bacterium]|nr:M20 family peptidase [Myxococcota bacterium]
MRRFALAVALALGLLLAVLVTNALRPPPALPPISPAPERPLARDALAERLARTIRVETVSRGDGQGPDPAALRALHARLASDFPGLHRALEREVIAQGSLLFRWPGSDASLAPMLLMAHLDVVPVEPGTEGRWTHPPFSGAIDDGYVWGRGTLDDKVSVVALAEATELLMRAGFAPRRTIYLAFGHDEEIGGDAGARAIAQRLAERGVRVAFTVDEGMGIVQRGLVPGLDRDVALIGLAEKGYLSLELAASAVGGHSSTPPREASIYRLARALERVEARPQPEAIRRPVSDMFDALAPHASFPLRLVLCNRWLFDPLIRAALRREPAQAALLHTTTAPTLLRAGVKDNVLPSRAAAVLNHRVLPGDRIDDVVARVRSAVADPNVEVRVVEGREASRSADPGSESYALLARTIREVFPDVLVAPALVLGGTDSKHYAGVAEQSFRFVPLRLAPEDLKRIHGTDERVSIDDYLDIVRFFARLMENGAS